MDIKDTINIVIAYILIGILYTISIPFILISGTITYINKIWGY